MRRKYAFVRAIFRRNPTWVISVMIHTKGPPKNATPIMYSNALVFWSRCASIIAASIPRLDASTAAVGIPLLLNRPSAAGA